MKCGSTNKICFSSWFILMLAMGLVTVMKAQPGNPEYSLSTSTFFEVDIQPIAVLDIETSKATTNFAMDVDAPTEAGEYEIASFKSRKPLQDFPHLLG